MVFIGAVWLVTGLLSALLIGLLCIPFALLLTIFVAAMPLAALIYGVIGAIETSQGKDFRYWLVGDWVRGAFRSRISGSPTNFVKGSHIR